MLYHNHVWRRELVAGSPDPDDPDDDQLLLQPDGSDAGPPLAFTRQEWAPLFTALRRYQPRHEPDRARAPHS